METNSQWPIANSQWPIAKKSLGLDDVEEVGHLGVDGAVVAAVKGVFLAVAEDVAQPVEIASLNGKAVSALGADFRAQSACNAVFEAVVNLQSVLLHNAVGPAAQGIVTPFSATLFLVANAEAQLRTQQQKALETASFASEGKACEEGHLDIVHVARIGVRAGFNEFCPSQSGVVDFGLQGAVDGKVFLAGIAEGGAKGGPAVHGLLDGGVEGDLVEGVSAVHTDGEVAASFTNLSPDVGA